MKKVKLTISGMHCASCAGNVESSLKKVQGVKEVSVNVMTNKGILQVDDGTSVEDLKKAVSKVGYNVVKVE